jgi:hypothetical protein
MASWRNISEHTYKDKAGTKASGAFKVRVQADLESMTPEQVKIRFLVEFTTMPALETTDGFYILYNANNYPESIGRKVIKLKAANGSWVQNEKGEKIAGSLTISKNYNNDPDFTIQDFWICNIGQGTVSGQNVTYSTGTKTFYDLFKDDGDRKNYVARFESFQLDGPEAEPIGKTNCTITDNLNNTFTIKATKGADGENNKATLDTSSLKWGYSSSYGNTYTNGETITLTPLGTSATRIVYANAFTKATYGDGNGQAVSKAIKQYIGPSQPTGLKIAYNKNRFTLNENWTLSWNAATAANPSSPVAGYRIRLYRKRGTGSWIKLPIYDKDGGMGHIQSATNVNPIEYFWDRDGSSTSATVYTEYYDKDVIPNYPDILPGDIIKFAVTAYTKYGTGEKLFKTSEAFSGEYTVENAGIMRVKAGGAWKEGQVWIKTNGSWKEAESVHIKTGGAWKESQ